jgi:peptidoglycan hydrolase-like protein with peptidoglycan-binding domain
MSFQTLINVMFRRLGRPPQLTSSVALPMFLYSQWPTLSKDQSTDFIQKAIRDLQHRLIAKGFVGVEETGKFDDRTHDAVCKFQKQQGLTVDGIVGCLTWASLLHPTLLRGDGVSPESTPEIKEAVKLLQDFLSENRFLIDDPIGQFQATTESAVKEFQHRYGLRVDGVVGSMTWAIIIGLLQIPLNRAGGGIFIPRPTLISCLNEFTLVASILIGIQFSVLSEPSQLRIHDIVTALALSWLVPWISKPFLPTQLAVSRSLVIRFGPYFLTGVLSRQIIDIVSTLIQKR